MPIVNEPFDTIRAYLNDPKGIIATDEALAPFVAEARAMIPRIAAALVAISRGCYPQADRLLFFKEFRCNRDRTPGRKAKPLQRGAK